MKRRDFVNYLGGLAAGTWSVVQASSRRLRGAELSESQRRAESAFGPEHALSRQVFDCSIASGDPTTSGFILWTRLNLEALLSSGEELSSGEDLSQFGQLELRVARDPSMQDLLFADFLSTHSLEQNHGTVKVDLDGQLDSDRVYYYQFIYRWASREQSCLSRVGRARTSPDSDRALTLAVLTCQDYKSGYYGGFAHLAEQGDVDFVVHLGDFIYETVGDTDYRGDELPGRDLSLPSGSAVAVDLSDYRAIYKAYRTDPHLQRAMENHTWIMTWDDHEAANDCYWDEENDLFGAPDHPFTKNQQWDKLNPLKLASQRAWSEFVPCRAGFDYATDHPHDALTIYRTLDLGPLVDLYMLDTRTYRSVHPCGLGKIGERYLPAKCRIDSGDGRTMLGEEQKQWLAEGLSASSKAFALLGNQALFSPLRFGIGPATAPLNVDAWDGYTGDRDWLTDELSRASHQEKIILTGDMHTSIVSRVEENSSGGRRKTVASELMTPSLTSHNFFDIALTQIPENFPKREWLAALAEASIRGNNRHFTYFRPHGFGYTKLSLAAGWPSRAQYIYVDTHRQPDSARAQDLVTDTVNTALPQADE